MTAPFTSDQSQSFPLYEQYLREKAAREQSSPLYAEYLRTKAPTNDPMAPWHTAYKMGALKQRDTSADDPDAPGRAMKFLDSAGDALVGGAKQMAMDAATAGIGLIAPANEESAITPKEMGHAQMSTVLNTLTPSLAGRVMAPLARAPMLARILGQAAGTGATNSVMQGASTLAETGNPREALSAAGSAFIPGAIGGGVMGAATEGLAAGAGALAKRVAKKAAETAAIPVAPKLDANLMREAALQATESGQRNLGFSMDDLVPQGVKKLGENIRTGLRTAFRTPYAPIEKEALGVYEALHKAAAANQHATYLEHVEAPRVLEGLTPEQADQFSRKLLSDTFAAKAERNTAALDQLDADITAAPASAPVSAPVKSSRDLYYAATTPAGKLRPIDTLETGALIDELERGADNSIKYHKDLRRFGPTSKVTMNNEAKIANIESLLESRDGITSDQAWNEIGRRRRARLAVDDDTSFDFGDNVHPDDVPLTFPLHEPEPAHVTQRRDLETALANHTRLASGTAKDLPADLVDQPWFQKSLAYHKEGVEAPLRSAYLRTGGTPDNVLEPKTGYLRGVNEDRLTNSEIERAMEAQNVSEPGKIKPAGPVRRFLFGENPDVKRVASLGAEQPKQGPVDAKYPVASGLPSRPTGATVSGASKQAVGSGRDYVTDYTRNIAFDARERLTRAAVNDVYDQVAKIGRVLADDERPALNAKLVTRTVLNDEGTPTVQRIEVSPAIKKAVDYFERNGMTTDRTGAWRKLNSAFTQAQIGGMPVEATSHANTLASIVASVPGEKDVAGKVVAGVPMLGGKAAAIREMAEMDFSDPAVRALQRRLAQAGALRIEPPVGGVVNKSHQMLFGKEGIDARGRMVLARKYLDRAPDATDEQLRNFVTSKLGNYVRGSSGRAVNLLQDAGVSSFARFQSARIPGSIASTFGASGLPSKSMKEAITTAMNTLARGPAGYAVGAEGANRLFTGHGLRGNEEGHQGDIATGAYAVPGGISRERGEKGRPIYLPMATINPVLSTGLRATGARNFIPGVTTSSDGGRIADAVRDVANTGFGVLSPGMRAASTAITGHTPYLTSTGDWLRTSRPGFGGDQVVARRLGDAFRAANPAVAAFGTERNDRIADAMTEDDGKLQAPRKLAQTAEFLLPRIASLGVGGDQAETSKMARENREFEAGIQDYKSQLRNAAGPVAVRRILTDAVRDAEKRGFNPEQVLRRLSVREAPVEKKAAATRKLNQKILP